MELTMVIILFIVGIVFIVKGGDYFVDAASWLAEVSGIPKLIIGATVVSLATTLPECCGQRNRKYWINYGNFTDFHACSY